MKKKVAFVLKQYGYEGLLDENTDSDRIDTFVAEYNWDDGFEVPYEIMMHKNCELGTALKLFYLADGVHILEEGFMEQTGEWQTFVKLLYDKIMDGSYKSEKIAFRFEGSRLQKRKLEKAGLPDIFLTDIVME